MRILNDNIDSGSHTETEFGKSFEMSFPLPIGVLIKVDTIRQKERKKKSFGQV